MSSLDELILFNSAFWREEGMLDGTKYAYMKKLAYLFEYEGKERLVFKVTASALVHVQLLVECFRRAGILPQGFGLGWRNLACDNKLGKPLFMSDTNLVWRSPTNPEQ